MRWLQLRLKMVIFCGENAILCRPALAVNSLPYFCLCEHVGNLLVAHLDPIFVKKSLNFTDIKGTSFIGVQDGKHPVNYVVRLHLRCGQSIIHICVLLILFEPLLEVSSVKCG
jgi:hypothetical protein